MMCDLQWGSVQTYLRGVWGFVLCNSKVFVTACAIGFEPIVSIGIPYFVKE